MRERMRTALRLGARRRQVRRVRRRPELSVDNEAARDLDLRPSQARGLAHAGECLVGPRMTVARSAPASPDSLVTGHRVRRIVLEQSKRAGVGHIGSALSVADVVAALYGGGLRVTWPRDPERDRFVLGKGHAVLAVYAALFLRGWLSQDQLDAYCGDNSLLGVHPERDLGGIDFST